MFFFYRETWIARSAEGGTAPNENHFFVERSRDLQPGSPAEAPRLLSFAEQAARTSFAKHPRSAEDFLFESGRFGSRSSSIGSHFQL